MAFMFSAVAQAQTIDSNYVDGHVYFQLNEDVDITYEVREDKTVDIYSIPGIPGREMANTFDIEKISCPFNINNDPKLLRTFKVEFNDYANVDKLLKFLANQAGVRYAEKVGIAKLFEAPNDPYYKMYNVRYPINWNWHLDIINAEKAWDIQKGSNNLKIGVIDGSIWGEHPDLQIPSERQYDGDFDTEGNSAPPSEIDQDVNPAEGTNDMSFRFSHGTHCAANIACVNNNGIGTASLAGGWGDVANGPILYSAKTSDRYGNVNLDNADLCINWIVNKGVRIVSMSYGGENFMQTTQDLINAGYDQGVIFIAAAGNESNTVKQYPAAYDHVISVAMVNSDYSINTGSTYGDWVDIAAPGGSLINSGQESSVYVVSATYSHSYSIPALAAASNTPNPISAEDDFYDKMQGTSMACPITASLVALMISQDPSLWFERIQDILRGSSIPLNPVAGRTHTIREGVGCIDAQAALTFTGIENASKQASSELMVFPNPATDYLTLQLGTELHNVRVEVRNILGATLISNQYAVVNGTHRMDVSGLNNGVYVLSIEAEGVVRTSKFVINK